jgi:hypothetical protein
MRVAAHTCGFATERHQDAGRESDDFRFCRQIGSLLPAPSHLPGSPMERHFELPATSILGESRNYRIEI